ncbi:MAG: acetate/propionate family kinase, partial [Ruminococcaceae bacterium]|nr:acetate/propionate family kinase [Oscillospiraceae bacterium]
MKILVINAGSSSLKYQFMESEGGEVFAKGLCERIGIDGRLTHKVPGREDVKMDIAMPTHSEAIQAVLDIMVDPAKGVIASTDEIAAVGHRVLHGGAAFTESCIIDDACIAAIEKCIPLGPLHNPANLMGIRACQAIMPKTPQVAVFDTAFHMTMPPKAYIYAIPYEYYEKDDVRRYGFHGTSHRYVSARAIDMLGNPEHSKIVCCHLGNGSSLSACIDGKCQDTTMGLGPLAGFPMGTRAGDIDATIMEYLMGRYGYDIKEMLNILNKKSGVLGISGVSSDF